MSIPSDCKVTVLLTAYRSARLRNIDPLVRSVLKCRFVEKVIVSNDNPRHRIAQWVSARDERLVLLDQPVRRGCKHRWELARAEDASYYLAIDDDLLIYPAQLAHLFMHLLKRPDVPHGLTGCTMPFRYLERKEAEVDLLCEIYAITGEHLDSYFCHMENIKSGGGPLAAELDARGDFVLISRSGKGNPLIHDTGFLWRCATTHDKEVATCMEDGFRPMVRDLYDAVCSSHAPDGGSRKA